GAAFSDQRIYELYLHISAPCRSCKCPKEIELFCAKACANVHMGKIIDPQSSTALASGCRPDRSADMRDRWPANGLAILVAGITPRSSERFFRNSNKRCWSTRLCQWTSKPSLT